MKQHNGFTLLEVLVALAILAVTLAAATRAANLMTDSASEVKQRTLATWVAQNRLAQHAARADWPETGVNTGTAEQAGMHFNWEERVTGTPNAAFRRMEIRVFADGHPDRYLAQLVGYLGRQKVE
jgi:general secretion pathway protein I